jgi:hypothetical protein
MLGYVGLGQVSRVQAFMTSYQMWWGYAVRRSDTMYTNACRPIPYRHCPLYISRHPLKQIRRQRRMNLLLFVSVYHTGTHSKSSFSVPMKKRNKLNCVQTVHNTVPLRLACFLLVIVWNPVIRSATVGCQCSTHSARSRLFDIQTGEQPITQLQCNIQSTSVASRILNVNLREILASHGE